MQLSLYSWMALEELPRPHHSHPIPRPLSCRAVNLIFHPVRGWTTGLR